MNLKLEILVRPILVDSIAYKKAAVPYGDAHVDFELERLVTCCRTVAIVIEVPTTLDALSKWPYRQIVFRNTPSLSKTFP